LTSRVSKALRAGEENLPAEIDWTRIPRADSRTQSRSRPDKEKTTTSPNNHDPQNSPFRELSRISQPNRIWNSSGVLWILLGTSGSNDFNFYIVGYSGSAEIAWGQFWVEMPE
jgi:hypothetical protein